MAELEAKKLKEYQEWLKNQEAEQLRLEQMYDCTVSYETKESQSEVVESKKITETTTTTTSRQQLEQVSSEQRRSETSGSMKQISQLDSKTSSAAEKSRLAESSQIQMNQQTTPTHQQPPPNQQPSPAAQQPSLPPFKEPEMPKAVQYSNEMSMMSKQQQTSQQMQSSSMTSSQQSSSAIQSSSKYSEQRSIKTQEELKKTEAGMQIKKCGTILKETKAPRGIGVNEDVSDWSGSLRPVSRAENAVLLQGDSSEGIQYDLKPVKAMFGGIKSETNMFITEDFDYSKHTVKDLIDHYSKYGGKGEIPLQYLKDYENSMNTPPLSYLHQQAQKRTFAYQERRNAEVGQDGSEMTEAEIEQKRRLELSKLLVVDPTMAQTQAHQIANGLPDISAILRGETPSVNQNWTQTQNRTSLRSTSESPSLSYFNKSSKTGGNTSRVIQPRPVKLSSPAKVTIQPPKPSAVLSPINQQPTSETESEMIGRLPEDQSIQSYDTLEPITEKTYVAHAVLEQQSLTIPPEISIQPTENSLKDSINNIDVQNPPTVMIKAPSPAELATSSESSANVGQQASLETTDPTGTTIESYSLPQSSQITEESYKMLSYSSYDYDSTSLQHQSLEHCLPPLEKTVLQPQPISISPLPVPHSQTSTKKRHVSKEDLEKMMQELTAFPPMQQVEDLPKIQEHLRRVPTPTMSSELFSNTKKVVTNFEGSAANPSQFLSPDLTSLPHQQQKVPDFC